jgi:hypothetical protein
LDQDAPVSRPVQRIGRIVRTPWLAGCITNTSEYSRRISFPGEPETRMRALIRRYIEEAATQEWPMLAQHTATLRITPRALAEALHLTLALTPETYLPTSY